MKAKAYWLAGKKTRTNPVSPPPFWHALLDAITAFESIPDIFFSDAYYVHHEFENVGITQHEERKAVYPAANTITKLDKVCVLPLSIPAALLSGKPKIHFCRIFGFLGKSKRKSEGIPENKITDNKKSK